MRLIFLINCIFFSFSVSTNPLLFFKRTPLRYFASSAICGIIGKSLVNQVSDSYGWIGFVGGVLAFIDLIPSSDKTNSCDKADVKKLIDPNDFCLMSGNYLDIVEKIANRLEKKFIHDEKRYDFAVLTLKNIIQTFREFFLQNQIGGSLFFNKEMYEEYFMKYSFYLYVVENKLDDSLHSYNDFKKQFKVPCFS